MERKCLIVGAGDFDPALLPEKKPGDLLIAADGGYAALTAAGFSPDVCIGDLDSLGFVPEGCEVIRLPVMKNETDMSAAALTGLERGYKDFTFFGVLGGRRFSHSVAALQTLARLKKLGASCRIRDALCTVTALSGETIHFPAGTTGDISAFAADGVARVTLKGLLYPLTSFQLSDTFPLGVSNAFTGASASVTAEEGILLLITE